MSDEQLRHLVKKANQIALNQAALADRDAIVNKVHEHLSKFWSPLMKQQIVEYSRQGQGELNDEAFLAAQKLSAPEVESTSNTDDQTKRQ